ncbi:MAG: hypothetical protein ABIJ08_06200 [Nanoarchaeota archaeon]
MKRIEKMQTRLRMYKNKIGDRQQLFDYLLINLSFDPMNEFHEK